MTAPDGSPLAPLLETLEDHSASYGEQTDAYLTLTSRITGEDGKEVIVEIENKLPRLYEVLKIHISSQNSELSCAALQALGFCLYNPKITSGLSEKKIQELLSKLNDIVKSSDKNVCTRALWVISKQTFPTEVVGKVVSSIIDSLEEVFSRGEMHSAVVDYEALNVIIRLIEQAPVQMVEESVRWAKLVIPLVVHSAQKVHLRGATALEMGMPLLLQKQQEIASITEQLMTTKLLSELQKLFMSKNETYVLKLWPLFVKLLGKTLHRSGSFINALLQLEELGFRSGAPIIKKIAFIAWKSLIDNFALNPEILCSAKRLKLLMQPLSSIHVRTEALALTKLEVWWHLLMRLGPHLPANFEQVCVPLIQSTICIDTTPSPHSSRVATSPVLNPMTPQHKGASPYGASVTPRMNLSSNFGAMATIPSIQLLGLEMLLHFFLGPEVLSFAKQNKLVLSLEPLEHPLISNSSFFSKYANTLITAVHDSFVAVGKDASDAVVSAIWKELINLVKSVIESGNKRERPGSEVLTLLLKSLETIVRSEVFPVSKTLVLMEITIKGLPQKVLGSPAYQVANMDILNGTPALFLIQLIFNNNLLGYGVEDERFFLNLEILVGCVLSGPTSPLAFSDSVLSVIDQNAKQLENKEHLWRMWSIIVTPLTELINQTNEVNQGDALEHNFSAIYGALTLPINHIFSVQKFPVATMKTLLRAWSELYRAFARCAALVATAEENLCCEELSSKIMTCLEDEDSSNLLFLDRTINIITVMVDCIDFSPYDIKIQSRVKSLKRPSDWSKKKKEPLGKLASLIKLIVRVIYSFHTLSLKEVHSDTLLAIGNSITSILSNVLGHISLPSMIRKIFATLTRPLALFYKNSKLGEVPKVYGCMNNKLEKLLGEMITCLHFSYTGTYDSELLEQLSPLLCIMFLHKNKHIRKQSAQFWNATFAKVTMLVYPEELKPVLREAKQKILLLLPGFENVDILEESSGPYSDATENSQLSMKISGMDRKSSGKRDAFLTQPKGTKEKMKSPVNLKLESSSPKTKSEMPLEEEKSIEFVFIPPEGKEAKERILTEHQKEVLKTKRCDIPAMYNNLDVSQDALFSQYTQEESMEIPGLPEKSKEDSKIILKEEQMKSDIAITQDVTENCGMEEHLEKTSLSNNECGSVEEISLGILSNNDDARKKALISSKKMSTECASSAENTSVASSSSSVSKATISGTLLQPTSRRQNFITLEKFDSSENRPFSLSPLNNVTSTVTVKNNQEGMTKTDIPLKAKKREVALSRSDSEKIVHGNKRTGLRSSKAEQTGNKRSRLLMRSDQEKNTQESIEDVVTLENNTTGLLNQTECVLDNQGYLSEPAVEREDAMLKPTIENALSENSTVEEKTFGSNLESKENTPPAIIPSDQIVNEDSHVQITPNQKTLRRSLRRRSDISEATADSQDKENNHQKKEKRKEEEKTPQKSPLHVKDDVLPKPKVTPEQSVQENLTEKDNLHQKTFGETSTNVEIDKNRRKLDLENIKSEGDTTTQDNTDKSFEKPVRGRTRYQTRRASQGLLSSIENSESDSSEAREEGSRKKRSGKWKNKNSDNVDIDDKEEKIEKQECVKIENQTHDYKASSEVDIKSQICEKDESNTVALKDSVLPSDVLQACDLSNTYEGKNKMNKCEELSFSNSSVSELNLRTRNANKRLHKQDSIENNNVEECSKLGVLDISLASEKSFQAPECRHKRSRRVRRSKGCDCCGEKSQPQEKSPLGLTNRENYNVKVSETTKIDVHMPLTVSETSKADIYSEVKLLDEHQSVNFYLGLKEENDTVSDSLIVPETELEENNQYSLPSEIINFKEEACDTDSKKAVAIERQEPSNKKCKTVDPCLGDSKDDNSLEGSTLEMKGEPEATLKKDISTENIVNVEADACKVKAELNPEEAEAVELDVECGDKSEVNFSEQKNANAGIFKEEGTEEKRKRSDESEVSVAEVLNGEEIVSEEFNSAIGHPDNTTPVKVGAHIEVTEQTAVGGLDGRNSEPDTGSSEMENCEERSVGEVNAETDHISKMETRNLTTEASKPVEAETNKMNIEIDNFVPNTLETITEEGKVNSNNTEADIVLNKPEEIKLDDSQVKVENDGEVLPEVHRSSEKVKETSQSLTSERAISGLITEDNNTSPQKLNEFDPFLLSATDSPSSMQARCFWSPSASPSSSILKRGLKRPQEDEVSSPMPKVRRVSFADPIYQAGLADDIDRRCSVVRAHSSNSSPTVKTAKTSPTAQSKHNTTSSKGFLFPGSRSPKFKSSKKCLITEMAKESIPCPTESIYPALVNCMAPVDIILPQITSNMWARGLGQLIRAKNIRTIGDLSTLTASEIKTLPIRSPKVSNVKKALRVYHEQQVKSRGLEEIPVFDISEKNVNGTENKPLSSDEERLASDLIDPIALETPLCKNLVAQVSALALQLDSEDLHNYSGSQLFEMHEKLGSMANSIIKNLQSRWRSPAHDNAV
ncbi:telomere-associated protein RIF1 isoform X2 [Artibeus jamaicensis]|nr:telomere-associated protein RIF1 isoform X2 [Artibeus jamaicensis]XP_036987212.2 telomere-associated protein RIF1 isoform X2 [Artibeus jamaicensis]XP_036987213.2 telomere-associated protein RIF1 isoform X2 [Artibeus jamaicensis]XP_036987214.2 telomere-associated protein RIF1 isoform X2 [Artibeus jamaicensis]